VVLFGVIKMANFKDMEKLISIIETKPTDQTLASSLKYLNDINIELERIIKERITHGIELTINRNKSCAKRLAVDIIYDKQKLFSCDFTY
jgi:hypothetical protein